MNTTPLETKILGLLFKCRGLLPDGEVDNMEQLVRAGEPGIALENLATQIYEHEVSIEQSTIDEISALGTEMGLDQTYWTKLT